MDWLLLPTPCRKLVRHRLGSFDRLEDRAVPAVFTVTNLNDSGPGSLRAAIASANAAPDADTVAFAPGLAGQTVGLTSVGDADDGGSALAVVAPVTVAGNGQVITRLGPANFRLFNVAAGASLTLQNLTLSNGSVVGGTPTVAEPSAALGGAVLNRGTLALANCTLSGNRAAAGDPTVDLASGGAVYSSGTVIASATSFSQNSDGPGSGGALTNDGGTVVLRNTVFAQNQVASGYGGAVFNHGGLQAVGTVFSQNVVNKDQTGAASFGGAIFNATPSFTGPRSLLDLSDSTFTQNQALASAGGVGVGGAIDNSDTLVATRCTFAGNLAGLPGGSPVTAAGALGGAVANLNSATLTDSTFAGNVARGAGPGFAVFGGGLENANGTALVTASTFASNSAESDGAGQGAGGAIDNSANQIAARLTLVNSILFASTGGGDLSNRGVVLASAPNIVGSVSNLGAMDGSGVSSADPKLGPLQDNGGPTWTVALLPGSAALGAGAAGGPTVDQRGALRGDAPDLGAYELANPLAPVGVVGDLFGPRPSGSANEAFVKGLYHAILQRDADAAGLQAAVGVLNSGAATRSQVALTLSNSAENRRNQVTLAYRLFLHRDPEPTAVGAWVSLLQGGTDEAALTTTLLASTEFAAQNDNAAFVTALYTDLLGRTPSPAEVASVKKLLDGGLATRAQLANTFLRSPEAVRRVVSGDYLSYLGRPADSAALTAAAQTIQSGARFGAVALTLLISQEFYADASAAVSQSSG
jgi:hypothetical protein